MGVAGEYLLACEALQVLESVELALCTSCTPPHLIFVRAKRADTKIGFNVAAVKCLLTISKVVKSSQANIAGQMWSNFPLE